MKVHAKRLPNDSWSKIMLYNFVGITTVYRHVTTQAMSSRNNVLVETGGLQLKNTHILSSSMGNFLPNFVVSRKNSRIIFN